MTKIPSVEESVAEFYRIFNTENVWQGEDDWTKNVPIGNLEDWLRKTLTAEREAGVREGRENMSSEIRQKLWTAKSYYSTVGGDERNLGRNLMADDILSYLTPPTK